MELQYAMPMGRSWRNKKLLAGFGAFLILTVGIGLAGIFQIYSLSKTIQKLGEGLLPREGVILKMKINNALYAMGVRNYIFWRTSKYLEAASVASDRDFIDKSSAEFKNNLKAYYSLSVSEEQRGWAGTLSAESRELENIGRKLLKLADTNLENKNEINKLLMNFESKSYRIDDFLAETVSKSNLKDIEDQLKVTRGQKEASMSILALSLFLSVILGLAISYRVYNSLKKERQKRELLVQKMVRLEEEERKNLSRQIHDQLSQDLSALKIYLELIESSIPEKDGGRKDKIEKSKKILANLIDRGHNISELLRPPELDDLGLVECIDCLISRHRDITGCNYNYYKPQSKIDLPPAFSLVLYRTAQETLANIAKHAQAKNVEISLQKKGNSTYFTIADNGVGFNYREYLKRPRRRKEDKLKLGLKGLRERIELLGGGLLVETAPGKGTKITVLLHC